MAKAVRTAADLGASVINISSVACVPVASALDDRALGAALAYAVDVKNAVIVAAAGNTGGAAQCPPQRAGCHLGDRHGRGQSGLVRRLRADRRLGEHRRGAVGIHSCRTLGGCRRPRRSGDFAWFGTAIRYQLCRAGGQRAGRADPGPIPGVDRAAGDAAHRVDRASPTRRMRIRSSATAPSMPWPRSAPTRLRPVPPPKPAPAPVPITTPPPTKPPHSHARDTALRGAAICLLALVVAVATGAARSRLRGSRNSVPGD